MKYLSLLFFTYLFALPLFAQQNSREGKDIAVFFTEEYKTPWDKLPLIKEEVAAIRAILEKKYHFITEEYKNEDAKGIEQRIEELRSRKYAEDAQLFLFFSGHGYYRGTGKNVEGFFVPYNATKEITTFLSYRLLRPRINEIPCKHILVMIDACESGTFSDEVASREAPDWENENELQSEWIKDQMKDTTRYFASSVVMGRSPAKSDFAAKLINALNEPPKDGLLSISGLKSHLEKANPAPYFNGFGDHKGGNFLFMTTPPLPPPSPAPLDTDKDGVPDIVDACPNEQGAECASGCPDKDGDCIMEKFGKDKCPTEKGEFAFDGCPDTDKDGVPDYKDKCKNVYAATENGCPPPLTPPSTPTVEEKYQQALKKAREYKDLASAAEKDNDCKAEKANWELSKPFYQECLTYKPNDEKGKEGVALCEKEMAELNCDLPDNLILVQGGTFQMGSEDSAASSDEKPVHSVTLDDFYMSKYEVTNEEYCTFLNAKGNQSEGGVEWIDLSGSWGGEKCRISKSGSRFTVESGYNRYPVIYVSWYGAKAYCEWLKETLGKPYSLPTEAQWEYAARSKGLANKYAWGNESTPTNGANVADETGKAKHGWSYIFDNYTDGYVYACPVEKSGINAIGLYGMSGNVWEWCSDYYGNYPTDPSKNPTGATSVSDRVLRGGSWYSGPQGVRRAFRNYFNPSNRNTGIGFRFVLSSR